MNINSEKKSLKFFNKVKNAWSKKNALLSKNKFYYQYIKKLCWLDIQINFFLPALQKAIARKNIEKFATSLKLSFYPFSA